MIHVEIVLDLHNSLRLRHGAVHPQWRNDAELERKRMQLQHENLQFMDKNPVILWIISWFWCNFKMKIMLRVKLSVFLIKFSYEFHQSTTEFQTFHVSKRRFKALAPQDTAQPWPPWPSSRYIWASRNWPRLRSLVDVSCLKFQPQFLDVMVLVWKFCQERFLVKILTFHCDMSDI